MTIHPVNKVREWIVKIFWINLEINFSSGIPILNDKNDELPEGASGFLQEIGCTADDENELKQIIKDNLCKLDWVGISKRHVNFNRIGEINQEEIALEIYSDPDIKESLIADPK
jgi:hypothetical protein